MQIAAAIPADGNGKVIAGQLSRSGPSVGANVEEADGAATRADKRRAFVIARKEARETRYWLRLIDRMWGSKILVREDIGEATQLLNILSTIIDKPQ